MRRREGTKQLPVIGSTCPVGRRPGGLGRTQALPCEHLLLLEGYSSKPTVTGASKVNPLLGKKIRGSNRLYLETVSSSSQKRVQAEIKCSKCRSEEDVKSQGDDDEYITESKEKKRLIPGLVEKSKRLDQIGLMEKMGFVERGNDCREGMAAAEPEPEQTVGSRQIKKGPKRCKADASAGLTLARRYWGLMVEQAKEASSDESQ